MTARTHHLIRMLPLFMIPACGVGTGSSPDDTELDTTVGAFSEVNCLNATPDGTNITAGGAVAGSLLHPGDTPATYSNPKCFRARVYKIQDPHNASGVLPRITQFNVTHNGPIMEANPSCADEVAGLQVYTDDGVIYRNSFSGFNVNPSWRLLDLIVTTGENAWVDDLHGGFRRRCRRPQVNYRLPTPGVFSGINTYLVVVTARRPDNNTTNVGTGWSECGAIGSLACSGDTPCLTGGYFNNGICTAKPPTTPAPTPPPSMTPPAPMSPPMPMTSSCSSSVFVVVGTCYNLDGTPSSFYTPNSTSVWGCGTSLAKAEQSAALALAGVGFSCLTNQPAAGCCTHSEQVYAGCYCSGK